MSPQKQTSQEELQAQASCGRISAAQRELGSSCYLRRHSSCPPFGGLTAMEEAGQQEGPGKGAGGVLKF